MAFSEGSLDTTRGVSPLRGLTRSRPQVGEGVNLGGFTSDNHNLSEVSVLRGQPGYSPAYLFPLLTPTTVENHGFIEGFHEWVGLLHYSAKTHRGANGNCSVFTSFDSKNSVLREHPGRTQWVSPLREATRSRPQVDEGVNLGGFPSANNYLCKVDIFIGHPGHSPQCFPGMFIPTLNPYHDRKPWVYWGFPWLRTT